MSVRQRRLTETFVRDLGETPLIDVELPVGSYLLELDAGDRPLVRYPMVLRRRGGWNGKKPGETSPAPIALPRAEDQRPGERFVAGGCFEVGGDELAIGSGPSECVWLDSFFIDEHPVSCAEIAAFLADGAGMMFRRGVLHDGVAIFRPDFPAVGLSWDAAVAFARWRSHKTGLEYRLPTEREWEKAARGVDGRFFPWGDFTDAALCHSRTVERTPRGPVSVSAFPTDVSPYGVRGMGGNVRDWCADEIQSTREGGSIRVVRGGSWRLPPEAARVAARTVLTSTRGYPDVGLRLVRSFRG
jgi:serine/threonine-protein kinase